MNLLLTLGHNSSAILVSSNGEVLCGYENERLTHVKSDSKFPIEAIQEIMKHHSIPVNVSVFVSHWFTNCILPDLPNKWWDPITLFKLFPEATVYSLDKDFTHHDAHCYSALAFLDKPEYNDHTVIVCDGFGNFGETLSIYRVNGSGREPELIKRAFGYSSSLGLFYQYATAYLGLTMNQDEYKLLGYEAHIYEHIICEKGLQILYREAEKLSSKFIQDIVSSSVVDKFDPMLSIDALPALRENYRVFFDELLAEVRLHKSMEIGKIRIAISHFVQRVVEQTLGYIVASYTPKDLLLVGGVFMNVKLNNYLSKIAPGYTSIMPLAGDQGAAIGVYHRHTGKFKWPGNLFWGKRHLYHIDNDILIRPRFNTLENTVSAHKVIAALISQNYIVNIVHGNMEFGARALGNTSTLARPTEENVRYINQCNERSTIMPMAGACKIEFAEQIHGDDLYSIHKSMEYMICTRDFKNTEHIKLRGAAHYDPVEQKFTGRTQIVRPGNIIYDILNHTDDDVQLVINTSFNPHGKPILFNMIDVINGHNFMIERDIDDRVFTFVITRGSHVQV